jgi:hypothetical protein
VKIPLGALGGRSFLDTFNSDDGETAINAFFATAEEAQHGGAGAAPAAGFADLGAILHFDPSDLDSNRAGLISPNQHSRLWHRDELQLGGAAVAMIAGIIFNVALLAGWMGTVHGRGAGLGVALMLIGAILGWSSCVLWLDLASGAVAVAEGALTSTTTNSARSGTHYFFVIAGKRFAVPREAWAQAVDGRLTKAYYLRRSETLLSVEPSG